MTTNRIDTVGKTLGNKHNGSCDHIRNFPNDQKMNRSLKKEPQRVYV